MKPKLISVLEVQEKTGHQNVDTARNWINRHKIQARERTLDGHKLYRESEVDAAIAAMPIGLMRDRRRTHPAKENRDAQD